MQSTEAAAARKSSAVNTSLESSEKRCRCRLLQTLEVWILCPTVEEADLNTFQGCIHLFETYLTSILIGLKWIFGHRRGWASAVGLLENQQACDAKFKTLRSYSVRPRGDRRFDPFQKIR
jgi:hypothetical protein